MASICAPANWTLEQVLADVNRAVIRGPEWQLSLDRTFRTGEPNPCPCNQEPDARRHYLLEC